ncbi:hypothetical protein MAR_006882 [Mya arenaria]|uniref:Uncharacterized protein n=1 Tax=Mya arenaria TaxID=6604 RepID=A0ABY7D9S4_MYAAR|nr:hypothetical protein MAR_006882 [Mya arenaria]
MQGSKKQQQKINDFGEARFVIQSVNTVGTSQALESPPTSRDSVTSAPSVIIPDSVVTAPPPYMGDNTGCPHLGPPPYFLGSGSSINSQPRFPPPYSKIEKQPPPSYSSTVEIDVVDSNGAIHGKSEKNNDRSDDNSSS